MKPTVLAFETSCDETAVAVVRGRDSLSNVLSSQVDLHARFGGVVPEVAARAHVESIRSLTHRALNEAGVHPDDLDGIAATAGPGLVGALLVGHSFGKATAWARQLPFVGIDHMEGHLMAPRLQFEEFIPPAVVLLASGGHSQIVHVSDWGEYEVLGQTIDVASDGGDVDAVRFPRALPDRPYDFSFSGLKTSVTTFIEKSQKSGELPSLADVAASVQEAIVDVLVAKTFHAVDQTGAPTVGGGGGVLANRRLRARFEEEADKRGLTLAVPDPILCTDNAAMIGVAGAHWLTEGRITDWAENVNPGMLLGQT